MTNCVGNGATGSGDVGSRLLQRATQLHRALDGERPGHTSPVDGDQRMVPPSGERDAGTMDQEDAKSSITYSASPDALASSVVPALPNDLASSDALSSTDYPSSSDDLHPPDDSTASNDPASFDDPASPTPAFPSNNAVVSNKLIFPSSIVLTRHPPTGTRKTILVLLQVQVRHTRVCAECCLQ